MWTEEFSKVGQTWRYKLFFHTNVVYTAAWPVTMTSGDEVLKNIRHVFAEELRRVLIKPGPLG